MSKTIMLATEEFKGQSKAGVLAQETGIRKFYNLDSVEKAEGDGDLSLRFTISTSSIDRDSDTIDATGWKLDNYNANPVVLWAHSYYTPPVGKAIATWVEGDSLKSIAQFTPKDLQEFGFMIYRLYAEGYMKAVSVGFKPIKWAWNEERNGGWAADFMEQELLEYSCVPVPANPEALLDAKGKGIDVAPAVEWAMKILDSADSDLQDGVRMYVPKTHLEPVVRLLTARKGYSIPGRNAPPTEAPVDSAVPKKYGLLMSRQERSIKLLDEDMETVLGDIECSEEYKAQLFNEDFPAKSGRVLSKANENKLKDAVALVSDVIAQVQDEEEGESEGEEGKTAEPSNKDDDVNLESIQLSADDDIDLEAIAGEPTVPDEANIEGDSESLKALIQGAIGEALNSIAGKLN